MNKKLNVITGLLLLSTISCSYARRPKFLQQPVKYDYVASKDGIEVGVRLVQPDEKTATARSRILDKL